MVQDVAHYDRGPAESQIRTEERRAFPRNDPAEHAAPRVHLATRDERRFIVKLGGRRAFGAVTSCHCLKRERGTEGER